MLRFAASYKPLIVDDHLIRLGYEARPSISGVKNLPSTLVGTWNAFAAGTRTPKRYQSAMRDRDLWLVATAAEVLGASKADPSLVPLGSAAAQLRELVAAGVRFFQQSRTLYTDTKDLSGRTVQSASYFNGDYADHPETAFSGYVGARFPESSDAVTAPQASWDVSHAYRIPVFLRSLSDNRGASGTTFPSDEDIRLVTNQYAYRAFNGDLSHPLFHNYFDGTDGWFRVNYLSRTGTGYPPSTLCDAHTSSRPCLSRGAIMAWGLLTPWSPDLKRVLNSILALGDATDADHVAFRNRYYYRDGEPLSLRSANGSEAFPFLLFGLTAELAPSAGR
jgi:hypothetical protein